MPEQRSDFRLTEGNSILLDLIRGLSAQAVVFGHALYFFGIIGLDTDPGTLVVQNFAVLIFFVLSGFLISYSTANKIKRREDYGFRTYFIDRFSRIYVTLLPALLIVLVLDTISRQLYPTAYAYDASFNLATFLGNLFMLQDIPGVPQIIGQRMTSFGSGQPFWTLAIEWWIYMFFGWCLLRIFLPAKRRFTDWVVLIPLLVVPSFNMWGGKGNGLMITWLLGSLAYLVIADGYLKVVTRKQSLLLAGWLTVLGIIRFWKTGKEFDPILAFLATAVILLMVHFFATVTWPRLLAWFSRTNAAFSYTLYLTHYSILDLMRAHFGESLSPWTLVFIGMAISTLIAAPIGLYVETTLTARVKAYLYRRF
jgi:peptidoglycan/LPS O-acetylase OafA/YrhL